MLHATLHSPTIALSRRMPRYPARNAMLKEFKAFALRGNVVDLAVAVVIGAAFGQITTSLVNDVIMPPIGWLLAVLDFSDSFINRSCGAQYTSLPPAQDAGTLPLTYSTIIH